MNLSCLNDQKKRQFNDFNNLQGKSVKNISEKRKGEKLVLVDDTGYKLDSPFECQSSDYL